MTAEEIRKTLDIVKNLAIKETNGKVWLKDYSLERGGQKIFFLKISIACDKNLSST